MHEHFVREEKGEKWEILDPLLMAVLGISTTVTFHCIISYWDFKASPRTRWPSRKCSWSLSCCLWCLGKLALAQEGCSGPCPKRCPGMESFRVLSLALTSTEFPKVLNSNRECKNRALKDCRIKQGCFAKGSKPACRNDITALGRVLEPASVLITD